MEYVDVDYDKLSTFGTKLSNSYQEKKDFKTAPILYDGLVYKFLWKGIKKKEQILLQLKQLELEYLVKLRNFFNARGNIGYIYEYDKSPLLSDVLKSSISLDKRFKYIQGLLTTHNILAREGLVYFDYHSANVLAGPNIRLLDIESIIRTTINNIVAIKRYLLELMISIFINKDLTFNADNSYLYELFAKFFDEYDAFFGIDFSLDKFFEKILAKTSGDAEELRADVIKLS